MKYLGVDFGLKQVGVAVGDSDTYLAFPRNVFSFSDAIKNSVEIIHEENIKEIVIGESVASNGVPNEVAQAARRFGTQLAAATGLPVHFQREDFSSVEAHRYQTSTGRRDDSAAAIILQRFLDQRKGEYTDDHGTNN